jgi:hypothetical protein
MRASLWPPTHLPAPSPVPIFRPAALPSGKLRPPAPLCSSPPRRYRSVPANADMLHFVTIKDRFACHVALEMVLSLCLETMEIQKLFLKSFTPIISKLDEQFQARVGFLACRLVGCSRSMLKSAHQNSFIVWMELKREWIVCDFYSRGQTPTLLHHRYSFLGEMLGMFKKLFCRCWE